MSAGAGVRVTLDVLDRYGEPASETSVGLYSLNGDWPFYADLVNGHAEGEVPAGQYAVLARVSTVEAHGETSFALVYRPRVAISEATEVLLDARSPLRRWSIVRMPNSSTARYGSSRNSGGSPLSRRR